MSKSRPVSPTRPLRPSPRTLGEQVPRLTFEQYQKKYEEYFDMVRQDGIIQVSHRNADGWMFVWEQAWRDIGNDPNNLVAIITNAGDMWIDQPSAFEGKTDDMAQSVVDLYDAIIHSLHGLVFTMNLPTIGVINGGSIPGDHFEIALACDLTLCSDDALIRDIHCEVNTAPGDGTFLMLQYLMGSKRASYYALTCNGINAQSALEQGLVNEVVPKASVLDRAWELAYGITRMSPTCRLMTTRILRRPLQKWLVDHVGFHAAHEMLGMAIDMQKGQVLTDAMWEATKTRAQTMMKEHK